MLTLGREGTGGPELGLEAVRRQNSVVVAAIDGSASEGKS